jgi:hypothetical protein
MELLAQMPIGGVQKSHGSQWFFWEKLPKNDFLNQKVPRFLIKKKKDCFVGNGPSLGEEIVGRS